MFYWPNCSPEFNPDKRLKADLKHALDSRVQVLTNKKLKRVTTDHMNMLQNYPKRGRSYFGDAKVKYAALINALLLGKYFVLCALKISRASGLLCTPAAPL